MKKTALAALAVVTALSIGSLAHANGLTPLQGNTLPGSYGTVLSANDADSALKASDQKLIRDEQRRSPLPPHMENKRSPLPPHVPPV